MADSYRHTSRRRLARRFGVVVAVAGLAGAALTSVGAASTGARVAQKEGGGSLTFGLEAESTGGFCTSQAQLAISGIQVVAAVYDTLTVPNTKGEYVPYLAESVTPNAEFNEWTIGLRDNIEFHNGEPLDAEAVKLNLDSFRGTNPNLPARLFIFVLDNIADVTVVDPLTVKVTTKVPWPAFPAYLYMVGRMGIMAPEQINDPSTCATNLIGTGPFTLDEWKPNEKLVVTKNPKYWQKGYPKADKITFVPVVDAQQRVNELQGGQLDLMHTSAAPQIEALRNLGGQANVMVQKPGVRETRYYMLNAGKAPLDDLNARMALAYALNRKEINSVQNRDLFDIADGPLDWELPGT